MKESLILRHKVKFLTKAQFFSVREFCCCNSAYLFASAYLDNKKGNQQ